MWSYWQWDQDLNLMHELTLWRDILLSLGMGVGRWVEEGALVLPQLGTGIGM